MTPIQTCLATALAILVAACSNIERSRNLADPNVTGKTLAEQVCSNCHGMDGNSVSPAFPKLAGQQPDYLANQLKGFRNHSRADLASIQYMWGLCRSLTDQQIGELASYYAKQSPSPNRPDESGGLKTGKEIFEAGISGEKNIPACQLCHGPLAQGKETFPRLASQHSDYIKKQLAVFKNRTGRTNTPMDDVAANLSDEQIKAIAAYLQAFEHSNPVAAD